MSDDKQPRRDHGGRRTYQEVVDERNEAKRLLAISEKQVAEQAAASLKHEQRANSLEAELRQATEHYQDGLELAMTQFETALAEAEAKVPAGALLFGCAHPFDRFPKDYTGTIVTDGTWWYCSFNHLRVGVQTRAGVNQ